MARTIRLDKMLSHMGYGTRSEVRKAVKQGLVTVDGRPVKDSGMAVDAGTQDVRFGGERVLYREFIYLMMNKPPGVISATEDARERTVVDLLSPADAALQPFPAGRLDKDTEGLLLLTNDGQLAHRLLSPRKHVPKTYEAKVAGSRTVGDADVQAFAAGVKLDDGYITMPAELEVKETDEGPDGRAISVVRLTIREGKYHQVKRMFEAVGLKVVHLRRLSMGPLVLDASLAPGDYRELTEKELRLLQLDG